MRKLLSLILMIMVVALFIGCKEKEGAEEKKPLTKEDAAKRLGEDYIKALQKGDRKFFENAFDWEEMFKILKKEAGLEYETTEAWKNDFLPFLTRGWKKKFTVKSVVVVGDTAKVSIDAEGGEMMQPLVLIYKAGKWKVIRIPMWSF